MTTTRRVIDGAKLRELREDTGPRLGLAELAKEAGISDGFLSRIERGTRQPSQRVLRQLVDTLVRLSYLPSPDEALAAISTRVPDERTLRRAA